MNTIRMGIITENGVIHDVFSYYRVIAPFAALRKHLNKQLGINLELSVVQAGAWFTFRNLDVVYMHRPWNARDLDLLREAKKNGAKVWVDVDDNYFELPNHFRHYYLYSQPTVRDTLKKIYTEADALSVSTIALAEQLRTHLDGRMAEVVKNIYPLAGTFPEHPHKESRDFSWRGTEETVRDLIKFAPDIRDFFKFYPGAKMHAWGIYPWPLVDAGVDPKQIVHYGFKSFEEFYEQLLALRPAFHLKLMDMHPFNHARSHCAWLEATHAGCPVVAPMMEEWNRPNTALYSEERGALFSAMHSVYTADGLVRMEQLAAAKELAMQHAEITNKKRTKILFDLLNISCEY